MGCFNLVVVKVVSIGQVRSATGMGKVSEETKVKLENVQRSGGPLIVHSMEDELWSPGKETGTSRAKISSNK